MSLCWVWQMAEHQSKHKEEEEAGLQLSMAANSDI